MHSPARAFSPLIFGFLVNCIGLVALQLLWVNAKDLEGVPLIIFLFLNPLFIIVGGTISLTFFRSFVIRGRPTRLISALLLGVVTLPISLSLLFYPVSANPIQHYFNDCVRPLVGYLLGLIFNFLIAFTLGWFGQSAVVGRRFLLVAIVGVTLLMLGYVFEIRLLDTVRHLC